MEWGITNRQGMTYGLLLAAAMLTLLPLLRRRRGGKLAGAIQGMMIGTPLGVCVNCAAPIAQGMLKGGGRVETALATLISSPTFNVIVLGIVFTLFPWYLAALKILAGLFLVLVVVPWLARLAERPGWTRPHPVEAKLPGPAAVPEAGVAPRHARRSPTGQVRPSSPRARSGLWAGWCSTTPGTWDGCWSPRSP